MTTSALSQFLGPLAAFYQDPQVMTIIVDAPDKVYVERHYGNGKLEDTDVSFESSTAVREILDAVLAHEGLPLAADQLTVDVRLSDLSRLVAVLPPAAAGGTQLTLHKMSSRTLSWEDLIGYGSVTAEGVTLLTDAVKSYQSILIAGGFSSGKTTIANRLAETIPADRRLVVVEERLEMQIDHPRCVRLEWGKPPRVAPAELLETAVNTHPDWLIASELQGPAAMAVLQTMSRHRSSMATIHAEGIEDALSRLEAMCLLANWGLGLAEIRSLIAASFRLIISQQRLSSGRRKIMQIAELQGVEHGRYILQPLMRYNEETQRLVSTGVTPAWQNPDPAVAN